VTAVSDPVRECAGDLFRLFEHGQQAMCRPLSHGSLALSGQTGVADLNMVVLARGSTRDEFLSGLDAVRSGGLDGLFVIDEREPELVEEARGLGLLHVGQLPLMERVSVEEQERGSTFQIRRAQPEEMEIGNRLAGEAFGIPEEAANGALPPAFLERPGNELWLAEEDGAAVGSGVFLRDGNRVGVYVMSTPAANQRRGIGEAILVHAMRIYSDEGVRRFTLGATEQGFPLYQRLGFEVVATPHLFVAGASQQFPGH
jgi:GNAT superfamily N-acetyltransferase